jgi:hypothetical protein
MSTEVLRLSGDYKIQANPGGTITMDPTGPSATTGTVLINGNLTVLGQQSYFQTNDTLIKDNVIVLNDGETNGYVTAGSAGVVIDRGNHYSNTLSAVLLFEEQNWSAAGVKQVRGIWDFKVANVQSALRANAILFDGQGANLDGRLLLFGNQVGMLNVGSQGDPTGVSYASRVTQENDIPNKYYVDHVVSQSTEVNFATSATYIQQGNSSVIINDFTVTGQPSNIIAYIDNEQTVFIETDTVALAGIAITSSTIRASTTNTDLILLTNGTGNIIANAAVSFQVPHIPPSYTHNQVKVYSTSTPGSGASGLLYVNNLGSDELTGARRAMVFSLIL